jgi:predicted flap endonuclease-1-like 5' DNA nuclease
MARIEDIEGIGPDAAQKLQTAGVNTVEALLEKGASPSGRDALAAATGIRAALILEWVNHADLYRIRGVGSELSDLLEAAGVDSVPELARRNAEALHVKIVEVNEAKKLVRQVPSASQVAAWIEEAKTLPRVVSHG